MKYLQNTFFSDNFNLFFDNIKNNSLIITTKINYLSLFQNHSFLKNFKNSKVGFIVINNSKIDSNNVKIIFNRIRNKTFSNLVSVGGGATHDLVKQLWDKYRSLDFNKKKNIKLIFIPTILGSGSEVTNFAAIWNFKGKQKSSIVIKNNYIYWIFCINSLIAQNKNLFSKKISIIDCLIQMFESIWNINSNTQLRNFAINSIKALIIDLEKKDFLELKTKRNSKKICIHSYNSGYLINKTKTSLCHSISYSLTNFFGIPHGYACAFSFFAVYEFNLNNRENNLIDIKKNLDEFDTLNRIKKIFNKFKINNFLKNKIDPYKLKKLIKFMKSERSNNNIIKFSDKDLFLIINKSIKNLDQ